MATIPDPLTDPYDSLESAIEAICTHRKAYDYAMVQKRSKLIAGTSEKRIIYLECDRHRQHLSISVGIRQAFSKAVSCPYSIVLRRKATD